MRNSAKKIKKILSLFIVFFLVFTVFAQAGLSKGLFSEVKEKSENFVNNIKEKTQSTVSNLKKRTNIETKDNDENEGNSFFKRVVSNPLIKSIFTYSYFKSNSNSNLFVIYTKYKDSEKETPASLGIPNLIDIDSDGKNDVKAKIVLRLSIEESFTLSLNFKLKVDRLDGISDKDEHLEVYTQIRFPGFLDESLKGNKVRFGILSEKYEEIPDSCEITYKYKPYVFSEKKPVHSTILNPGNIVGNDDLNILFGYVDVKDLFDNNIDTFNVKLEPAVKTEITLTGFEGSMGRSFQIDTSSHSTAVIKYSRYANNSNFDAGLIIYRLSSFKFDVELTPFQKGGGRIEYQRQSNLPVEVLLFFENTNNSNYFFAEDIPSHIKVSWNTAQNNLIKVDCFGERCTSVGWRNALLEEDVTAKAYLSNLPSYIELNWIGKLAQGEIELKSDIGGCSAHVFASELNNNGFISADIHSSNNFDFSVYWDFSRQVFGISRSNIDLFFDVSFYNLLGMGESANVSFKIKNEITSPFEFCLDELLDFDVKIEFTGNDFALRNVDVDLNIPSIGSFVLKMNSFEMTRQSSVYFAFSVDKSDDEYEISCNIHVSNGVMIRGLVIGYNDFLIPVDDIDIDGEYDHTVSLSVTEGFAHFHINKDGSGYVVLSGGISLFVDSDFFNDDNILVAHVEGTVAFLSEDDCLNISWDSNGALTIDGSGVLSLSGFNLWVKDKFEISISSIVGSFTLDSSDNSGNLNLVLSKSVVTLVSDFDIDFEDFKDITFKAVFSIDGSIVLSGNLKISWGPGGVQISTVGVGVGVIGDFSVSDLYFKMGDMFEISSDSIVLSGSLALDFSLDVGSGSFGVSMGSSGTSISVKGFDINYPGVIVASFTEFYLGGSGFITVGSSSSYKVLVADVSARVRVMNLFIGSNGLGLPSPLQLSFSTDLSAAGQIEYVVGDGYEEIILNVWGTKPIRVDNFYFNLNSGQILASWNKLHIGLSAFGKIRMGSKYVYLDASLSYVIFDDFEIIVQGDKLNINGEVDCLYSGTIDLKVDSYTTPYPEIEIDLNDGLLEINDFYFKYTENNGKYIEAEWDSISIAAALDLDIVIINNEIDIDAEGSGDVDFTSFSVSSSNGISASFDSLNIDADLNLDLVYNIYSKEVNVEASGNGHVEINAASLSMSDTVGVSLGYFKLDLDDVHGSIINLLIGEDFDIESASVSGSITSLEIQDFYCSIGETEIPGLIEIDIFEINADFTGSGEINFQMSKDESSHVYNTIITGSLSGESSINIQYADLLVPGIIGLELEDFILSGPTTFYLNAEGSIDLNAPGAIEDFSLNLGCTSTWSAKKLYILGMIYLDEFEGEGDISLGAEINGGIGDLSDDYFVVGLNGNWNWDSLNLFAMLNLGVGFFNGNMDIKIDLEFFMGLFVVPGPVIADEADFIIDVKQSSSLDIFALSSGSNFFDNLFSLLGPLEINVGTYTLEYMYNVAGNGLKTGSLFIDTNYNWITLPITIKNKWKIYGNFRSDDWLVEWDLSGNIFNWNVNVSGQFDLDSDFGMAVYVNNIWRTFGADPNELNAAFYDHTGPMNNQHPGDKFKVIVADDSSGSTLSGAQAEYLWEDGSSQGQVLTTGSDGITEDYFTCYIKDGEAESDCKIKVTHPDYSSPIYLEFHVEPGSPGYCSISGQVLDVSTFWDPLPGATVSCSEDSDVSDSNGDYSLAVSPGDHTVTATYPGYETKTATITVVDGETSTYTFNMMPDNMGSLIGWAKIDGTDTGIPDATVTAIPGGESVQTLEYGAQKGRFDMYLEPGEYDLTITKDGYEDGHVYNVNIYNDQETNIGDIGLVPINEPPVAVLNVYPTSANVGEIVTFDFSDSFDPDGDAIEYRVRWDSDTEPGNNDWSTYWFTDNSKTHIYDTPGTKKAWLQVKDSKEATDVTSVNIVINPVNWVSPDSDEYNLWWKDRYKAHDEDESSSSYYGKSLDSGWCDYNLVLTYNNPVDCNGFRIKAKNYDHLEKMKITLYDGGNQKYSKEFSSWEYHVHWTYHLTSDLTDIDRVKISFKLESGYKFGSHNAHVYEFDLRES